MRVRKQVTQASLDFKLSLTTKKIFPTPAEHNFRRKCETTVMST